MAKTTGRNNVISLAAARRKKGGKPLPPLPPVNSAALNVLSKAA